MLWAENVFTHKSSELVTIDILQHEEDEWKGIMEQDGTSMATSNEVASMMQWN